jgi:small-conductance mechanosensitive channel
MKTTDTWIKMNWYPLVLLGLFLSLNGYGQDEAFAEIPTDSALTKEIIPFNEVLIAAGESKIRTVQMSESLISRETIERENNRNDSILVLIDSALSQKAFVDYRQQNQRSLTNEKNYWQSAMSHIKAQKKRLSDLIRSLQSQQATLENELQKWKNTEELKDSSYAYGNIREVISSTTGMLDSLASEIGARTELLIAPLNKTVSTEVEVELLLKRIQQALQEEISMVYARNTHSLFEKAPAAAGGRDVFQRLRSSLRSEWIALSFHFNGKKNLYALYLVFVLLVLSLFFWLRTRLKYLNDDNLSYYESTFKTVLKRPLSAGLLFCLFFTVAFFPNRPPLFVDLVILAMLIPLLDIALRLTPGKIHGLFWVFALLLVLLLVVQLIPEETTLFRYALFGLGLVELLMLFRLYRNPKFLVLPNMTLTRFVRFLVVFHLLAVFVGIIGNVLGYAKFSQVAITSFLTNTLVGILLFICAIVLIGGLQFFVSSKYLKTFKVVRDHKEYLKDVIARIVIIGVTLFWLDAILRIFYVKDAVYEVLGNIFTRDIALGSMTFSLAKILLFVFIIWFSIVLSKVIKIVLRSDVLDKFSLKKGIPRMITAITQFALITLGILMAVRSIGMPLDQLTIILSAFSVGIGFGLQNIFNNLVSGVILLFEREVQIGDVIEINNLMGRVTAMGIRSSHIKTFDGADVIVPNGQLISQEVVDWTLSDKSRRIEIISGVAYGSDVHLVKKLLMQIIVEHPDIKQEPEPLVLFNDMGESSLDFRLLFWTANFEEWLRIRSEVIFAIHDTLKENNIVIPFPQRDLHLKSVEPSAFRNQKENNSTPREPS